MTKYGLSLSNQYWIKKIDQDLSWSYINFFNNDFEYQEYLDASLNSVSLSSSKISFCRRLNLDYCDYKLDVINNQLVSKCSNFLTKDEEIISACDIMELEQKNKNTSDYEHYISILEDHGITDARKKMSDMYLVDYTDRRMKNYGVIRNIKTLKWERVIPIFDTGNSLQTDQIIYDINIYNLSYIEKYDLNKLDGLVDELKDILNKYGDLIELSGTRSENTLEGFKNRINNLQK